MKLWNDQLVWIIRGKITLSRSQLMIEQFLYNNINTLNYKLQVIVFDINSTNLSQIVLSCHTAY